MIQFINIKLICFYIEKIGCLDQIDRAFFLKSNFPSVIRFDIMNEYRIAIEIIDFFSAFIVIRACLNRRIVGLY
ncbi:hypothetical protein D3C78_1487240 [compost metagenome]